MAVKAYTYNGEGPATVYLDGQPHQVEPGDTLEAKTAGEQDSLDVNPDFTKAKAKAKK